MPLIFTILLSYYLFMFVFVGIPLAYILLKRNRYQTCDDITDADLPPDVRERTQAIRDIYTIAHDPALWSGESLVSRKVILLSSPLARAMIGAVTDERQEHE